MFIEVVGGAVDVLHHLQTFFVQVLGGIAQALCRPDCLRDQLFALAGLEGGCFLYPVEHLSELLFVHGGSPDFHQNGISSSMSSRCCAVVSPSGGGLRSV